MIFTCAPENEKRDGVDYRDVKAWFQQCRDYKIDVDRQLERIHRIYGSATKITQNLSGMPTASGNGDKIGNAAVDIIEEQTRYREMVKRLTALQNEATKRAYCLVVATECANAIVDFYVNGKTQDAPMPRWRAVIFAVWRHRTAIIWQSGLFTAALHLTLTGARIFFRAILRTMWSFA